MASALASAPAITAALRPGYYGGGPYYGGGYGYRGYGYGPAVSVYEPDCRVVRVRTRTPSGRVVVRTREVCD